MDLLGRDMVERPLYAGVDVGRKHDLTVVWVVETLGDVLWTRAVRVMERAPFRVQADALGELLRDYPEVHRLCIDATGIGAQLGEELAWAHRGRVEPVVMTAPVKEGLAVTMRRRFEDREVRIPVEAGIREDLHSVRRYTTAAGNIRYDAERSEAGHADRFWALALAMHAASGARVEPMYYERVGAMRGAEFVRRGCW